MSLGSIFAWYIYSASITPRVKVGAGWQMGRLCGPFEAYFKNGTCILSLELIYAAVKH